MKNVSVKRIYSDLCMIPPHPELREKLFAEYKALKKINKNLTPYEFLKSKGMGRKPRLGLDDNLVEEPQTSSSNAAHSIHGSQGADLIQLPKFKPKGDVNILFLLADFLDMKGKPESKQRLEKLLNGTNSTSYSDKSLKEYYKEVSYGAVNVNAYVSDWITLDKKYSEYTKGDGLSEYPNNAQKMVEDVVEKARHKIDWKKFNMYGDGMIEALCVVHAGRGAEVTGPGSGNIWSHKYNVTRRIYVTKFEDTYAFTYLTVPEDAKLGVIAHEMGHLLFGWPDLYDSQPNGTRVTEGVGRWCLMASGSWNNNGSTPAFPSAWCRHGQGWTETRDVTKTKKMLVKNIEENREVYRLWNKVLPKSEYFMIENRQKVGFDSGLPGDGILIHHIDELMPNNWEEDHLAVGIMQADGERDLQSEVGFFRNQGDASDTFPGTEEVVKFGPNTTPNSRSYSGKPTGINVILLSKKSSKQMPVQVQIQNIVKI